MSRARPLPAQRSLFTPDPAGEVIASLRTWPDAELSRLARAVGYELIRRGSAVPVALPVGEAMQAVEYQVPSIQ